MPKQVRVVANCLQQAILGLIRLALLFIQLMFALFLILFLCFTDCVAIPMFTAMKTTEKRKHRFQSTDTVELLNLSPVDVTVCTLMSGLTTLLCRSALNRW